jgi:hypothetical protein
VSSARTRLVRDFDPDEVNRLKAAAERAGFVHLHYRTAAAG